MGSEPITCPQGSVAYSFEVKEGNSLTFCEQESPFVLDENAPPNPGQFSLIVGGKTELPSSMAFETYVQKYQLPVYGINLKLWNQMYRGIFPKGASERDFYRFNDLIETAQMQKLDPAKAFLLAQKFFTYHTEGEKEGYQGWGKMNSYEKFLTFEISLFLMDLKKGDSPFYLANKDFIDTVYSHIESGKLGLKDSRGDQTLKYAGAAYHHEQNSLIVPHDYSAEGIPKGMLIHELFHFYQDIQKFKGNEEEIEIPAYLKAAQFQFLTEYKAELSVPELPQVSGSSPGGYGNRIPSRSYIQDLGMGVWLYLQRGNLKQAKAYEEELILLWHKIGFITGAITIITPHAERTFRGLVGKTPASHQNHELQFIDSLISQALSLRQHYSNQIKEKSKKEITPKTSMRDLVKNVWPSYVRFLHEAILIKFLQERKMEIKIGRTLTEEEKHRSDQEFKKVLLEGHEPLSTFRLLQDIPYETFDGV